MRRTVIIEGIVLIVLGIVGVAESIRLIVYKASQTVQDILGAGPYILVVSIPLFVIGIFHVFSYKQIPRVEKVTINKEMRMRIILMIGACAIYIFLIYIVGYLLATLFFFLLEFRAVGIKSWRALAILTVSISAAYYIVFVIFCDMVFPRGILFE